MLAALLLVCGTTLAAQQQARTEPRLAGWVLLGAGEVIGNEASSEDSPAHGVFELVLQRDRLWGALHVASYHRLAGSTSQDALEIQEQALVLGLVTRGRHLHGAIGAGPAVVRRCNDASGSCGTTPGAALVARAALRPVRFAGLGIQLSANLNPTHSVAGAALFFQFGKLWQR